MEQITNFDDFLQTCPLEIRKQYLQVRNLILRLVPKVQESISYNAPFYKYQGLFMYFSIHKKKKFMVGFCQGFRMGDEMKKLSNEDNQKQIRHWELKEPEALDENLMAAYILEASEIQEKFKAFGKEKNKK